MVSESGEIIGRLLAGGANYQMIGEAVGRNRSLMRQIALGAKPGNNLREALAELERRVSAGQAPPRRTPVAAPPRRVNRAGALAKVRKPVTIRGRSWTASTVKKGAVSTGAKGLGHTLDDAARSGRQVAVTVSVDGHVAVEAYGSSRRGRAGLRGSADFKLGDAEDVWAAVHDQYGGDVTAYVADQMIADGLVSGVDASFLSDHIVEIDMRTFD